MKKENIFKKSIRQRRTISSNIFENGSYNYSEEERNKSKNSLKSFHRKTSSSYFHGHYLSSNLENALLNNINIEEIYKDEKFDESLIKKEKDEKNCNSLYLNNSNANQENNFDIINLSFHSYEFDNSNNNSLVAKTEENLNGNNKNNNNKDNNKDINNGKNKNNKNNRNDNNTFLNNKDNKYNTEKSFLSFKNNLKYVKDKEERATKSYLLALGMTSKENKIDEKEQYLPTASVIEEEKSELIESKSEFSNKKKNINTNHCIKDSLNLIYNKNKIFFVKKDNKLKIKNISKDENINIKKDIADISNCKFDKKYEYINVKRSNNNNDVGKRNDNSFKENEELSFKMTAALNDIITKNNKKKENKRKFLKKNKTILLNSFFNMTYKGKKDLLNENYNNEKIIKNKDIIKKTENYNNISKKLTSRMEMNFPFFYKRKMENYFISNLIKNRFNTENSDPKRSFKTNILKKKEIIPNYINNNEKSVKYDCQNNSINSYINTNNNKTFKNKDENKSIKIKSDRPMITKIEYKLRSKIPHLRQKNIEKNEIYKINKNNYTNKNSAPNKKYLIKMVNIPHKKTYSFTKDKININLRDNYNLHSLKQIKAINEALTLIRIDRINSKNKIKANSKNNKNSNSSSFTRPTRSNSKSSHSKEKIIVVNKANSSSVNYRNELSFNLQEDINLYPCNKNQTFITLKDYLIYSKSYIKMDVLEKIVKTFNSDKSFFIVFCEKFIKVDNNKCNEDNINKNLVDNYILLFRSLMKYYQNQNRFIKIYGDENYPNVISVKNIDINNYFLYQVKKMQKENKNKSLIIESINELRFTTNAIIICKK